MVGHLTSQFGATDNGLRKGRGDGFYDVLQRGGGYQRIWARRMALQEAGHTPEQAVSQILKKFESQKFTSAGGNILIALRDQQHRGLADGNEYLAHFSSIGWSLQALVLMHSMEYTDRYLQFGLPTYQFVSSKNEPDTFLTSVPIAHRVGQIRNHFGWA